ncbi:MAG: pantetheine-phosphate adenylyltransferase [Planctomycetes bacterium]|nr:pantetheine-phosphate adenylyltransferase [Planctomycetota bacterium]
MPKTDPNIVAVYPGTFDPLTHGHLDVIRRAACLFNTLVVGIGENPDKQPVFSQQERFDLMKPHIAALHNVRVEIYRGLTIDFVRKCGGRVLVRGIRDINDLSSELQQANVNLAIGGIETVFVLTSDQHVMTSSTYVKQIYELGGGNPSRLKRLVPDNVARMLAAKLGRPRRRKAGARTSRIRA